MKKYLSKFINSPLEGTIIFFIIATNLMFSAQPIGDPDYFWHMKVGEYIFNNKVIPVNDIFSWYGKAENLDWFSHEWLTELIMYLIEKITGTIGLVLLPGILMSITIYVVYRQSKKDISNNRPFAVFWFSLYILANQFLTTPRPHAFSFLLMAVVLYIINKYRQSDTKLIWIMPLISIIWVNLHGGSSSMLFVLMLIAILTGLFNFKFLKITMGKLPASKLYVLTANLLLSIGTAIINPKGYRMLLYPIINMGDSLMLNTISEWASPDLKDTKDLLIFIAIGVAILIFLVIKDNIDIYDLAILLAFTYLSLKSVRFIGLFLIAVTPLVFKYIPQYKISVLSKKIKIPIFLCALYALGLYITAIPGLAKEPHSLNNYPSYEAIEVIKEHKPERLFNLYGWGGYLIYNDVPVFIDGRADMYSSNIYPDYIEMEKLTKEIPVLMNKYDFDMYLVSNKNPLSAYLAEREDFELIFSDDNCDIYKRVSQYKGDIWFV